MILIDKPRLKFLLAGRAVTVSVKHDRFRKGRTYAVGVRHNHTICHAVVLGVTVVDAGWELEVKQSVEDLPRLLARNPGGQRTDYVSQRAASALDEPEAVDAETQARLSALGTLRWQQDRLLREQMRQQTHLRERVRELELAQATGLVDVSAQLRVIRLRLKRLVDAA